MSVKKIFVVLITIVACVVVGALVLNIILPNVATSLVDTTEQMVYKATKLDFDWNGNGTKGSSNSLEDSKKDSNTAADTGVGVAGFGGTTGT